MLWANWVEGHPGTMLSQVRDCARMVRSRGHWLWRETPCESFAWTYYFICQYSKSRVMTSTFDIRIIIVIIFVILQPAYVRYFITFSSLDC